MSFSADWLTLRRSADAAARNAEVAAALAAHFAGREQVCVLDLGAGTGSNRALTSPHLPPGQSWTLVDADAALLAEAEGAETRVADLASDLEALITPETDLVTCSALLDLCGADWLDRLAALLARHRLPLFAVLSYDGYEAWEPSHPADAAVQAAFLADQRRDKGLGPSLGPEAHTYLAQRLSAEGFTLYEGRSDWDLTLRDNADLIAALAAGTGAVGGDPAWTHARQSAQRVVIGHLDLFAVPPAQ